MDRDPSLRPSEELHRAEELTREIGDMLTRLAARHGLIFAFILADREPEGFFTYTSNGTRADMVALLAEAVKKLSAGG